MDYTAVSILFSFLFIIFYISLMFRFKKEVERRGRIILVDELPDGEYQVFYVINDILVIIDIEGRYLSVFYPEFTGENGNIIKKKNGLIGTISSPL